jgi:hypothetical protein
MLYMCIFSTIEILCVAFHEEKQLMCINATVLHLHCAYIRQQRSTQLRHAQ